MKIVYFLAALIVAVTCEPTVYFKEDFSGEWEERWVQSEHSKTAGKFVLSHGKFYGDAEKDKGLQTSEDAKFYGMSAKLTEEVNNEGKTLVIQFTVKHEQNIDCGGGYAKLFPAALKQKDMHGESEYAIMFGPDICGPGTKKVHVIFNYNGINKLVKKDIRCKDDVYTHLYTLVLKPDGTYEVKIDNEKVEGGSLEEDWDFLEPKKIKDPEAKKPDDWEDDQKIANPEDKKPEDWEKPETIPDPDAKKPDDWDDEMDGDWEPAQIDNPLYKGEWKAEQIDNPNYNGEWVHPEIENPAYKPDEKLYHHPSIAYIGFDLWQVKSGTIFDNILITDDEEHAKKVGAETWGKTKEPEQKMKEKQEEEQKKVEEEEEKKRKAEEDAKKAEGGEDEEEKDEDKDDEDEDKDEDVDKDEDESQAGDESGDGMSTDDSKHDEL